MARRLAVLGCPIGHSLSPRIHAAAYRHLGLDWEYEAIEVQEDQLAGFLNGLDNEWLGFSVTMPLKAEALAAADTHGSDASVTELANTLVRQHDGRWHAENTDVNGLKLALREKLIETPGCVQILGSGATAKSAVLAVKRAYPGVEIQVAARNVATLENLKAWSESLGVSVIVKNPSEALAEPSDLVVSTVPNSAHAEIVEQLSSHSLQGKTLFDVSYSPWPSVLAKRWIELDGAAISGVEMLLQQALLQIDTFLATAGKPVVADRASLLAAMRAAV